MGILTNKLSENTEFNSRKAVLNAWLSKNNTGQVCRDSFQPLNSDYTLIDRYEYWIFDGNHTSRSFVVLMDDEARYLTNRYVYDMLMFEMDMIIDYDNFASKWDLKAVSAVKRFLFDMITNEFNTPLEFDSFDPFECFRQFVADALSRNNNRAFYILGESYSEVAYTSSDGNTYFVYTNKDVASDNQVNQVA